jgi:hypothetical protein
MESAVHAFKLSHIRCHRFWYRLDQTYAASFFGDADIPLEGLSKPFYKIVCDASAREPVLMILGSRCVQYSGQGSTASATDEPDTNEVDAGLTSCGCCPVALAFTLAVVSKRPATV